MKNATLTPTDIPLLVLGDDDVAAVARDLSAQGLPMAVVGSDYASVVPFMTGRRIGYTVALVADVDDPIQLADVLSRVESRLGPVTRTVR
ncbi:hypothetical protein [Gordonia hydrophobica]|uniref:Uncharacterized protein n=1 Tax=Gordonia hydrophobica TaxID=40516 RepID=A0ABZ2U6R5_9ACTN|nr:hypothetical protein [Gordonia hydrophobica]MBM7366160.1 hypothetical protein [Gordonia hydrophobica]